MNMSKKDALLWLMGQAEDRRKNLAVSVVLAVLGVICSIVPYFLIADIIKALMDGSRDSGMYMRDCGIIALLWMGNIVFHALSTSQSHVATFHVLANIRKKALDKLARMPLGDVLGIGSGSLKTTIVERIDSLETTLAHIIPEFTSGLVGPIVILVMIFTIDWRMGLASLVTVPLGMACYMGMMIGYEENFSRTVRATKNLNDTAVEYINGIQVIKVFGKAQSSYEKFVEAAKEGAASYVDWMRKCNVYFTFAMCIMPSTMVSVLPIGGLLVRGGSLGAADFIEIIILTVGMIAPLITCMSYSDDIAQLAVTAGEVKNIIDAAEMERSQTAKAQPKDSGIELSDVHFGYGDKEILHGVSMDIRDGSYIALVGPSGSGKSTIARLIASLWDVNSGSISYGGVNIKDMPLEEYNRHISYVSQDNYLFNLSVRENIRLGAVGRTASDEEVELAAKRSGCHEFIMGLEHGYDTVVGASGGHLSGGERQRIAIARAMLKNADVIILDEATAYTDPENEAIIQASVSKLIQGKTLIVIAHRLSTVKDADCLYVIKDGEIFEQGTHEQLIASGSLYKTMWEAHMSVKDSGAEGGEENV